LQVAAVTKLDLLAYHFFITCSVLAPPPFRKLQNSQIKGSEHQVNTVERDASQNGKTSILKQKITAKNTTQAK